MPLADEAGGVARLPEALRQGRLGKWQADRRVVGARGAGIELVAEALLVTSGQEPGAGRAAVRPRDIPRRAADAARGQRVEMGGGHVAASLEAEVGVAEIVGDDDDDVGTARRLGGSRNTRQHHQRDQSGGTPAAARRVGAKARRAREGTWHLCIRRGKGGDVGRDCRTAVTAGSDGPQDRPARGRRPSRSILHG